MGRGLSELQKIILLKAENNGITSAEACDIVRLLQRPKDRRRKPRPANRPAIWASASRALTRLWKRGLLVFISNGRHLEKGEKQRYTGAAAPHSWKVQWAEWTSIYVRADRCCEWVQWIQIWHDYNCRKREESFVGECCQGRIHRIG